MGREAGTPELTNVISLVAYKYRRYVMDQPRDAAVRLATLNWYQIRLFHDWKDGENNPSGHKTEME